MSKPSEMEREESRRLVAEMYVNGSTRDEIGEVFNVHRDTISDWTARPDVQAIITKLREERANRITRRVDKVIEGRLEHADKMDTETLLKIRKEFGGGADVNVKVDTGDAVAELLEAAARDPELAAKLMGQLPAPEQLPEAEEDEETIVDAVVVDEEDGGLD
jgi:transposase